VPGAYVTCLNSSDNVHLNWPNDGWGQGVLRGLKTGGEGRRYAGTGEICCRLAMHANATFATV